MAYNKKSIDAARKQGAFGDKVFDPRVLELSEDEKNRIQKNLDRLDKDKTAEVPLKSNTDKKAKTHGGKLFQVELNFLEKIFLFLLSFVGVSAEEYKRNKAVHAIEKNIGRIHPPIYNASTKRVTKFFAYKIYDLYLKLFTLKKVYSKTLGNSPVWNNSHRLQKSGIEFLFEKLANINSTEVDNRFSRAGISRTISEYDSVNRASESVVHSVAAYLEAIDKSGLDEVGRNYTNIVYFKEIVDFDYLQFFKRFDTAYASGGVPNFSDIYGDAVSDYLQKLEEAFLQIDLSLGNLLIFKKLEETSRLLDVIGNGQDNSENENEDVQSLDLNTGSGNDTAGKLESELVLLFEILKELTSRNYLTLLIQIIKRDPNYSPSFIRTKYDMYKIYSEVFQDRVRNLTKECVKEKKRQKIEENIRKSFNSVQLVGIYNSGLSEKLEQNGFLGFQYSYHAGVIHTFLTAYYEELIKSIINTVLMSGVFMDKHFQKSMSDTFYEMEKYHQKFKDFSSEISQEGLVAKKLLSELARHDMTPAEQKKSVDRTIITINAKAKDLYEQFYGFFVSIGDIIVKLQSEIDAKPPKYIRNIHSISGLKNIRFLNYITNMANILSSVKESLSLLRE